MTYLNLEVEFHSLEDFASLVVPIDIFRSFMVALGDNSIGGNFNKYYDPQRGMVHPRIAVRVNVKDEVKAKEIMLNVAQNLCEEGKIRHYENQLSFWTEPEFVVNAHELGTACATELRDRLLTDPELSKIIEQDRRNFLFEFVYVLLKQLGFRPFITWSLKRSFPVPEGNLVEIAAHCAQICRQKSGSFDSPDSLERFIHAFLNCVGQEAEGIFLNAILSSQLYQFIFDSLHDKSSG